VCVCVCMILLNNLDVLKEQIVKKHLYIIFFESLTLQQSATQDLRHIPPHSQVLALPQCVQ